MGSFCDNCFLSPVPKNKIHILGPNVVIDQTHERQKIKTLKNKVLKFSESLIKQRQKRSKFDTRRFLKEHRSILRRNSMSGASFEAKI